MIPDHRDIYMQSKYLVKPELWLSLILYHYYEFLPEWRHSTAIQIVFSGSMTNEKPCNKHLLVELIKITGIDKTGWNHSHSTNQVLNLYLLESSVEL